MKNSSKKRQLVMNISTITDDRYGHVNISVLEKDNDTGELLGFRNSYDVKVNESYQDMTITCQSHAGSGPGSYGWRIFFRPFGVDSSDAERIYKTVSRLEKKVQKRSDEEGYPKTFGEYVLYVAEAIGTKEFRYRDITGEHTVFGYKAVTKIDELVEQVNAKLNRLAA